MGDYRRCPRATSSQQQRLPVPRHESNEIRRELFHLPYASRVSTQDGFIAAAIALRLAQRRSSFIVCDPRPVPRSVDQSFDAGREGKYDISDIFRHPFA